VFPKIKEIAQIIYAYFHVKDTRLFEQKWLGGYIFGDIFTN
jgi:hypothetical protein